MGLTQSQISFFSCYTSTVQALSSFSQYSCSHSVATVYWIQKGAKGYNQQGNCA